METNREINHLLDLIQDPAFTVIDGKIHTLNGPAQGIVPEPGTPIAELICSGAEEYASFQEGCLYLTLKLRGAARGASLRRIGDQEVFTLDREDDCAALNALALAARELRQPLSNVMLWAQHLLPDCDPEEASRMNRGLYQMMRILANMTDASGFEGDNHQETVDICAYMDEIFEKAAAFLEKSGIQLAWQGLREPIFSLADPWQLERAVLSILSNAAKFTPAGGVVEATLTRKGRMLCLSIQDSGRGIPEGQLPGIFSRYQREPIIEDGRYGLGLGMVLIRSAARNHGGTVLIDQPQGKGTRVTMTLAIRQRESGALCCPVLRMDRSGGMDQTLIELSQILPPEQYMP